MSFTMLDYVAGALALVTLYLLRNVRGSKLPLPPGPPRWPLIGALLSMPRDEPSWMAFIRWGKETGSSVLYVPVLGQDTIVLNSREAAVELLEKRSASYSDRPVLVMAGELVGFDQTLGLSQYGRKVKDIRRLLHDAMSPKHVQEWWPLQEKQAIQFLQRLLHTPEDLIANITQAAGASVVKLTYGYTVKDKSDEYIMLVEETMDAFSVASTPGMFIVDVFPLLKYIPWAPFKRTAAKWHKFLTDANEMPMKFVHDQMKKGTAEPSFVSKWLEQPSQVEDHEATVKYAAGGMYGGGTDTTVSAISTFFLAMVHYPSAQADAQAEIERVIGPDKLPTYADRASLPYVEAVYKEVLRWQPLAPIGIPHRYSSKEDDEYLGMRIPAGATIVPNVWGMQRDPKVYPDPASFNPSRFMGLVEVPNPEDVAFGFGRRRCPGIAVAQSSVWMSIAFTLAAYNITPVIGANGKPQLPPLKYSNTTVSHPEPFQCTITVRSEKVRSLIEQSSL